MTRSNSDLWCAIGGSSILLIMMCCYIYVDEARENLGLILPVISFLAGYVLHQNLNEMEERSLKNGSK